MRIKILVSRAGLNFAYQVGEIVEHPDDAQAVRWIKSGGAELAPALPVEEARQAAPENAAIRRRRAGQRPSVQ